MRRQPISLLPVRFLPEISFLSLNSPVTQLSRPDLLFKTLNLTSFQHILSTSCVSDPGPGVQILAVHLSWTPDPMHCPFLSVHVTACPCLFYRSAPLWCCWHTSPPLKSEPLSSGWCWAPTSQCLATGIVLFNEEWVGLIGGTCHFIEIKFQCWKQP